MPINMPIISPLSSSVFSQQRSLSMRQPPARRHFVDRLEQRGLRPALLSFILTWGIEWRARGATHITVLWRMLPPSIRDTRLAHAARDWVVLMDDEGSLLTCYRHRGASRFLRRKPKRRLSALELARWNRLGRRSPPP